MARVRIGARDANRISGMLRTIADRDSLPRDLRANAIYWAGAMRRTMDERDLQMVAWLLLDASGDRGMPVLHQRKARYWASSLEARL
jgi:hypothetical protein